MSTKWRVDYRYFKFLSYLLPELADNRHKLGQVSISLSSRYPFGTRCNI